MCISLRYCLQSAKVVLIVWSFEVLTRDGHFKQKYSSVGQYPITLRINDNVHTVGMMTCGELRLLSYHETDSRYYVKC